MSNDLTALDDFLEDESQRDFTRVLRFLLYTQGYAHVLVYGAKEALAPITTRLTDTFPALNKNVFLVTTTSSGEVLVRSAPAGDGAAAPLNFGAALRALMRQDPDTIAIIELPAKELMSDEDLQLVVNAAMTGQQLLIGCAASSLAAAREYLDAQHSELSMVQFGLALEAGINAEGKPRLVSLQLRTASGFVPVVHVSHDGSVVVHKELLPEVPTPAPLPSPRLAPPLSKRPVPTIDPRPVFIPTVGSSDGANSMLGGTTALRLAGGEWPRCRSCGEPLVHLLTLDLEAIPAPLPSPTAGLAQLFVCANADRGCKVFAESDEGVCALVLEKSTGLTTLHDPVADRHAVIAPGAITGWDEYQEDPDDQDAPAVADTASSTVNSDDAGPLLCDKLGGWPAWAQGNGWPRHADGSPYTLLFQFHEGGVRSGGFSGGWDYEQAVTIPSTSGDLIVDPNLPRRLHDLWSGDAVALLFIDATGTKLALRVQMS